MRRITSLIIATLLTALASQSRSDEPPKIQALVNHFCIDCHDADQSKGDLNLAAILADPIEKHPEIWEKVTRRLVTRQMPPQGKKRPDEQTYNVSISDLENTLDHFAVLHPSPGRTDTLRRLTRTEYQNAVRDLLAVNIDAAMLLPADEASHGFDNVTVGNLSPTLLDRYVSAAEKISRLAVGRTERVPGGDTIRIKPDITQEDRVEDLPFGTRGGALIPYTFPRDGQYDIQIRLTRDRNEMVEGLHEPHELEFLLDREQLKSFTVKPPADGKDYEHVDAHLKFRFAAKAGPHDIGVTFLKNPSSLLETIRQPYTARINMHRSPRINPAIYQVSITGPFEDDGPGQSPSRKKIFITHPAAPADENAAAKKILSALMRKAWRRPITDADLARILPFYQQARTDGDFDAGIESALSAILVSREFLFRVERDPADVAPHTPYAISDLQLATRLSFFLWSSIPDEELLAAAERNELHKPEVLEKQTARMLADPRSQSLVTDFADQWLHLRNLNSITPDGRLFPDFDDNLRQSFRRETEMLFEEVITNDQSILKLLESDHTFLNERLAKHYDIPNIYGQRFRRVELDPATHRGGILRQGSILTVTSYATRTSPVLRGKWILDNLLGQVPPPPPPNVPALEETTVSQSLPMRQRLMQHRASPACASCHNTIDPVGFSLENFDAIGRYRTQEEGTPVDATGGLPDGSRFTGASGLEHALANRPDIFATTLTEKLMTYALGRGTEISDAPAIRRIIAGAGKSDYRFSSLIQGIVSSTPFKMRTTP